MNSLDTSHCRINKLRHQLYTHNCEQAIGRHADEFEAAEGHSGVRRQRTKGRDFPGYLVEHEELHVARRCVHERG